MSVSDHVGLEKFMAGLKRRNPGETEFHQAVFGVASNVFQYISDKEIYHEMQILRRIAEPDRIIIFRVCWEDDNGAIRVNRGYRIQNSNAIGPYKGGLRFHPSVNLSILKFLAFEQTFKNSLTNRFVGVLTGKGLEFGGSPIRTEATGYGTVYMMEDMLKHRGETNEGRTCLVSGAGNVATYAVEKLNQLGAKVVTMSDSTGFIYDKEGIDAEKLAFIIGLKTRRRGGLSEYAADYDAEFFSNERPWRIPCDIAFPCATQNEISAEDALMLIQNGCIGLH